MRHQADNAESQAVLLGEMEEELRVERQRSEALREALDSANRIAVDEDQLYDGEENAWARRFDEEQSVRKSVSHARQLASSVPNFSTHRRDANNAFSASLDHVGVLVRNPSGGTSANVVRNTETSAERGDVRNTSGTTKVQHPPSSSTTSRRDSRPRPKSISRSQTQPLPTDWSALVPRASSSAGAASAGAALSPGGTGAHSSQGPKHSSQGGGIIASSKSLRVDYEDPRLSTTRRKPPPSHDHAPEVVEQTTSSPLEQAQSAHAQYRRWRGNEEELVSLRKLCASQKSDLEALALIREELKTKLAEETERGRGFEKRVVEFEAKLEAFGAECERRLATQEEEWKTRLKEAEEVGFFFVDV